MTEKVIHRIWMGGPMPEEYCRFGEMWAALNPSWHVHDWSEDLLLSFRWRNQLVLEDLQRRDAGRGTIELYVQLADVLSYELLWEYGGIYINVDIEPIQPLAVAGLDHFEFGGGVWLAREDETFVVNAAMGAAAAHATFFDRVVEQLGPRYFSMPRAEMTQQTGPRLLTDVWRSFRPQPVALPVHVFNPFHWSTIELGGDASGREPPPGCIGIHHWGHRKDQRTNIIEQGRPR